MLIRSKFSGYQNGIRIHNKGGGGGSTYYANQDKLLGVQADIAQGIYNNIYQPYAPGATADLNAMRTEDLATKARNTAGADAGQAMGQGIASVNRNMARYGLDPHKFASDSNIVALGGAANKVNAMNKASEWGENQKWARTYDFYNALSGIPSNASASLGSAAAGYGSMGRAAQDDENAGAAGWGKAGGMIGSALFSKDGGMVRKECAARMAAGGLMRLPDWRSQSTAGSRYAKPAGAAQSFLSSAALGAVGSGLKGVGSQAFHQAFRSATSQAPALVVQGNPVLVGAVPQTGTAAAGTLAADATTTAATDAAANAAAETAATEAATTAAADTAATAAGTTAATNAWNPLGWAAAVYGVGNLAGWWKDGGPVRKDMESGGKVSGPGGPREDKVPAWLSDGEYVLPAKTVKAMGGTAALDPIVKATNDGREPVPKMEGNAAKHAAGGLGVAMGAAVDEINRQRELQDRRRMREEDVAYRNARAAEEDRRWATMDARTAAMHGIQMSQAERHRQQQTYADKLMESARQLDSFGEQLSKLPDDAPVPQSMVDQATGFYNTHPTMQDGKQISVQNVNGMPMFAYGTPGRSDTVTLPITKQTMAEGLRMSGDILNQRLAMASPESYQAWWGQQQQAREKQADRASHEKIAVGNNQTSRDVAAGNNQTSLQVANINERGANARNAASIGVQQGHLTLAQSKDTRDQKRIDDGNQALSDMDAAERTGDTRAYSDARRRAIASGVKLDRPEVQKADVKVGQVGDITVTQPTGNGGAVVTNYGPDMKQRGSVTVNPPGQSAGNGPKVGDQRKSGNQIVQWDGKGWVDVTGRVASGAIK